MAGDIFLTTLIVLLFIKLVVDLEFVPDEHVWILGWMIFIDILVTIVSGLFWIWG